MRLSLVGRFRLQTLEEVAQRAELFRAEAGAEQLADRCDVVPVADCSFASPSSVSFAYTTRASLAQAAFST